MIEKFQHTIKEEIEKLSADYSLPPSELYEPIRYMFDMGGKRIRPLFVLLACDIYGGRTEEAVAAALALELFHNFSLVHDDIMDNAPMRRNHPTVHQKWNSSTAILSGDVMLVKAYQLVQKSKIAERILPVFSEMAVKVCEGQQWDLNYEKVKTISVAQYFEMIGLKTAALIAASMKIGALLGGADKNNAELMNEFGYNTGMAFQLQDDLLDVYGNEKKFGKQSGGDIIANKKTYLLIKAIELSAINRYKKEELEQWLSFVPKEEKDIAEKIHGVKSIYDFVKVKEITEREINLFHKKAVASLEKISAPADKKKVLADFTSKLLLRES